MKMNKFVFKILLLINFGFFIGFPTIVRNPIKKPKFINNNDAIIFFNLRSDRARQITKPFVQKNFEDENPGSFKRHKVLKNLKFVALTNFGPDLDDIATVYKGKELTNTLPSALKDIRQYYLAEREKYAHVTYFFNGGHGRPVNGEIWRVVKSAGVQNYESFPQMSIFELTDIVCEHLRFKDFDFITVNFSNADMIGHTGNINAAIKAIQYIDQSLGKIHKALIKRNGLLMITADHGNVEEMVNIKTHEQDTEHSSNPVPLIIVRKGLNKKKMKLRGGILGDIAPTILDLIDINKPKEMTGRSLIVKSKLQAPKSK